ncbi:MAG: hypothetical protein J7513_06800 [Solirubrobacteraceae bacterium]|nr:hypothetical protein [Solirubrobacteraceae bacterium]
MSQPGIVTGLHSASVLYGTALTLGLGVSAARRRRVGPYGLGGLAMLWIGATVVAVATAARELTGGGDRLGVVLAYCVAAALLIPILAAPRDDDGPGAASAALAGLATVAVLFRLTAIA